MILTDAKENDRSTKAKRFIDSDLPSAAKERINIESTEVKCLQSTKLRLKKRLNQHSIQINILRIIQKRL